MANRRLAYFREQMVQMIYLIFLITINLNDFWINSSQTDISQFSVNQFLDQFHGFRKNHFLSLQWSDLLAR